jgi:hypothetical protein
LLAHAAHLLTSTRSIATWESTHAGTATTSGGQSNRKPNQGTNLRRKTRTGRRHNTDYEFTTLNVANGSQSFCMEIEEAIIVALLAVGMSLLAVLTIMVFW